jgi:TPR repeat protein
MHFPLASRTHSREFTRLPSADLRSWTTPDHDQAAHWYHMAAEQGGKTRLKRLGYSFLLTGIATITGYAQETAEEYASPSRAVPKGTAPRMQVRLLSGGEQTSLPKSRRSRHGITHLFG